MRRQGTLSSEISVSSRRAKGQQPINFSISDKYNEHLQPDAVKSEDLIEEKKRMTLDREGDFEVKDEPVVTKKREPRIITP